MSFYPLHRRNNGKSEAMPIFWADCNNNNIDQISGLPALFNTSLNVTQTNKFVLDPTDSGRYCMMKNTGDNNFLGVQPVFFPHGLVYQLANNNGAEYVFLDNNQGVGHRLEFMVYTVNNSTNRYFLNTGDNFANWWQSQNSMDLGIFGSNLTIFNRNNSTVNNVLTLTSISNIATKWITVQYDVTEINSTQFSVVVKILDDGVIIANQQFLQTKPLNSERYMILFGSHYSYGASYQNLIDMIKEVKIFKQTDLTDFSIYG